MNKPYPSLSDSSSIWNSKRRRTAFTRSWCIGALLLLLGVLLGGRFVGAQGAGFDLERIQRATVFIMQARNVGDTLIVTCVGSGTIVSRDGLILTNAHNTVQGANCPGETLVIAISPRLDEPPVPRFRADIVQADPGIDLALLRITRENDNRLIDPGTLALPFVELGSSDAVALDDTLTVVGYPGMGDDPIAIERGTVSGFAAEPSGGEKSWIKTSASIPGAMSGGGAYDGAGRLVGIPTTAPVTLQSPESSCVILQDSTADGLVNSDDICVPVGGFINSLRPSNFARPLLRAASLGLTLETITNFGDFGRVTGTPRFGRLFFSPAVNEANMPTSVIRSLPTGSTSLHLFFDYENMTPETVYELRVSTDGIPNPVFSLSPVRWSGGRRGLWYVGSSGQPFPNGVYDFTLFINGVASDSARLLVGRADETPAFSDLVFGIQDARGAILGNGFVLGVGNTATARFIYRNLANGTPWATLWYYEGVEIPNSRTPDGTVWNDGGSGTKEVSIQDPNGLLPGNYRVELYIDGRLSATSDFTLAGGQDGAFTRVFGDTHFTTAATQEEAIAAAAISRFSAGTESIYALFDWRQMARGTLWRMRWSVDGDPFYDRTTPWNGEASGDNFLMQLSNPGGIPDGTYSLELWIGPIQFVSTEARVGIGQLPIDRFAQASGIQMRGQITDADTGAGIPGVTFVLVSELYSAADFVRDWSQEQVYALAITDRDGRFQIDRPLQPAVPYSVVIVAQGYLPVTADGVEVSLEDNPIDVQIALTRG
jgi:S1-C subfamily serine protease